MSAYHTSGTNQSAQYPRVAIANKRPCWICDSVNISFAALSPAHFVIGL